MKRQKANSLENITWSELGKQNLQAKKVYCLVCVHVISSKHSERCHVMTFRANGSLVVMMILIIVTITIKIVAYKAQNTVL